MALRVFYGKAEVTERAQQFITGNDETFRLICKANNDNFLDNYRNIRKHLTVVYSSDAAAVGRIRFNVTVEGDQCPVNATKNSILVAFYGSANVTDIVKQFAEQHGGNLAQMGVNNDNFGDPNPDIPKALTIVFTEPLNATQNFFCAVFPENSDVDFNYNTTAGTVTFN
jgi:hypothetical protein